MSISLTTYIEGCVEAIVPLDKLPENVWPKNILRDIYSDASKITTSDFSKFTPPEFDSQSSAETCLQLARNASGNKAVVNTQSKNEQIAVGGCAYYYLKLLGLEESYISKFEHLQF